MEETYEGTFAKFKKEQFEIGRKDGFKIGKIEGRKEGIMLGWKECINILLKNHSLEEVSNLLQINPTELANFIK